LADYTYNKSGNYDTSWNIHIIDNGPSNIDNLIKDLSYIYTKYPYDTPKW
jgi:hypothetical protein